VSELPVAELAGRFQPLEQAKRILGGGPIGGVVEDEPTLLALIALAVAQAHSWIRFEWDAG